MAAELADDQFGMWNVEAFFQISRVISRLEDAKKENIWKKSLSRKMSILEVINHQKAHKMRPTCGTGGTKWPLERFHHDICYPLSCAGTNRESQFSQV